MRYNFIFRATRSRLSPYVLKALIVTIPLVLICGKPIIAQVRPFTSGSTGADGALNFATPGMVYFDPSTIPNHKAGDTVFNFTTINVATGVILRFDSRVIPGPVYWLATGDVTLSGTLDLTGQNGNAAGSSRVNRIYSVAGAGGFGGGPGGGGTGSGAVQAEPGAGPGGGRGGTCSGAGSPAVFSGSQYLIPLIGGSGGGGGCTTSAAFECGGGAGGGAILIASSTKITNNGYINAYGGAGGGCAAYAAAGGSGGAVRLVANNVSSYAISVVGQAGGGSGFARLEGSSITITGSIAGNNTQSTPIQVTIPQGGPSSVTVTSVAGIPITANPFTFPDVTINTSSAVPVIIQGQNVPAGSIPTLIITSETGQDQVITAPALQAVAGNALQTTSTVNIAYPPGGSKGLIRLTWSQ